MKSVLVYTMDMPIVIMGSAKECFKQAKALKILTPIRHTTRKPYTGRQHPHQKATTIPLKDTGRQ